MVQCLTINYNNSPSSKGDGLFRLVMYQRSKQALRDNPPPQKVCFIDCQFGKASYKDVAGTIHTRISAGGCWFVQVEEDVEDTTE